MDPMDPLDKRVYYRTNNYPMAIKTSYYEYELWELLFVGAAIKWTRISTVKHVYIYKCSDKTSIV